LASEFGVKSNVLSYSASFIFNKENKTVHLSWAMFMLELGGEEQDRPRYY
jgi:hypothetical protein